MNKKQTPHIITAVSIAVLFVLGLACSTYPDAAPVRETSGPVSLDRAIQIAARSIEDSVEKDLKIALLSFRSPTEQFSEYVLEELSGQLVQGKKLVVVDRRELDLIRQEEEFQLSDDVSDESAQAIGKKLGAQLIVSGSLSAIGNVYRIRIRALYVETAVIAALPASDISASEERVVFLLGGKGPIQVNTSSRQTPASSENLNVSVYVAGVYENGRPCYWVNGVRTDLPVPGETESSNASAIVVSDGKVYAAGGYFISSIPNWNSTTTLCYWIDGVRTDLPLPSGARVEYEGTSGIAVSGGRIYAAGQSNFYGYEVPDKHTACYWVNGVKTEMPVPGRVSNAAATAIAISDGRVYVAGWYYRSGRIACYWADGVRIDLPVPEIADSSMTSGIEVLNGKVYVSGYHGNTSDIGTACYWVDGIRTDLDIPGRAGASGIAVGR